MVITRNEETAKTIYNKYKSLKIEHKPDIVKKPQNLNFLVQQKFRQSYWEYTN